MNQAIKFDDEKQRTDLLPMYPLLDIAAVYGFGAKKYEGWNWCKGFKYSRLLGSLLRHIFLWAAGEDKDGESGYSHLAHAGCCLLMLMDTIRLYPENDDRQSAFINEIAKSNFKNT
jgi:hypothetical protein